MPETADRQRFVGRLPEAVVGKRGPDNAPLVVSPGANCCRTKKAGGKASALKMGRTSKRASSGPPPRRFSYAQIAGRLRSQAR